MAEYETLERKHSDWTFSKEWAEASQRVVRYHGGKLNWGVRWKEERTQETIEELEKRLAELVRSEIDKVSKEVEGLTQLQKQIESGRVVVLQAQPLTFPSFNQQEVDEVKKRIMSETPADRPFDPFDFAEKNDLNVLLVLRGVQELAKEGRLEEVR